MAAKRSGISRELIIHPGETIADVLEERDISQVELAVRTGVSPAYVSNVIAGKKDISANFANALEYALDVPKTFWLSLQMNYEAELLELNEKKTITEEERGIIADLQEIANYLRKKGKISEIESGDEFIFALRKALQISNLENLKKLIPIATLKLIPYMKVNPYVLGAWVRLCQMEGEKVSVERPFEVQRMDDLIEEIKLVMLESNVNIKLDLQKVFLKYGIEFSVMKSFKGAPVCGYVSQKRGGAYQLVMTVQDTGADVFWFTLFHELGHIINGDVSKSLRFVDSGTEEAKERAADEFARNHLMSKKDYKVFLEQNDFDIEVIKSFAHTQNIMPYMVIGRLQGEEKLESNVFEEYKVKYQWEELH